MKLRKTPDWGETFLLAAAALPYLDQQSEPEKIRLVLQKILRERSELFSPEFASAQKKQVERLLVSFFQGDLSSTGRLQVKYPFSSSWNEEEKALARLFIYLFLVQSPPENQFEKFQYAVKNLSEHSEELLEWTYLALITETFEAAQEMLAKSGTLAFEPDVPEKLLSRFSPELQYSQTILQLGAMLAENVLRNETGLDRCLNKFLTIFHIDPISGEERLFLKMALYELAAEGVPSRILRKAISQTAPPDINVKMRKFLRNTLLKAANSYTRELAFQMLYAFSFKKTDSLHELEKQFSASFSAPGIFNYEKKGRDSEPVWKLVSEIWRHEPKLDEEISKFSNKWRIDRIGRIELLLLRMGVYEITTGTTPPKVVISEIMDLTSEFGVQEARSLINGILDAVARSSGRLE